jgi:hypothetical protein
MKSQKIVSLCLMLLAVLFFFIYLWWGSNHNDLYGAWGVGIWLIAVGTFVTGAMGFFDKNS